MYAASLGQRPISLWLKLRHTPIFLSILKENLSIITYME